MTREKYTGPACYVVLTSRSCWIRSTAEDLARRAGDPGEAPFLDVVDIEGDTIWIRARAVEMVVPATVVSMAEAMAVARGPAGERQS